MSGAKIRLSQKELELVTNSDLILTKNAILEKTKLLLGHLQQQQFAYLHESKKLLPGTIIDSTPKISKGENYKGLPYLVLDYPRIFEHTGIFAIRTIFWWGNFFSITLHLSGNHKKHFKQYLIRAYAKLVKTGFFICKHTEEWDHHFDKSNYISLATVEQNEFEKIITQKSFLKLAMKIPAGDWNNAPEQLFIYFKEIIDLLSD